VFNIILLSSFHKIHGKCHAGELLKIIEEMQLNSRGDYNQTNLQKHSLGISRLTITQSGTLVANNRTMRGACDTTIPGTTPHVAAHFVKGDPHLHRTSCGIVEKLEMATGIRPISGAKITEKVEYPCLITKNIIRDRKAICILGSLQQGHSMTTANGEHS
jgi:hypothetical protein